MKNKSRDRVGKVGTACKYPIQRRVRKDDGDQCVLCLALLSPISEVVNGEMFCLRGSAMQPLAMPLLVDKKGKVNSRMVNRWRKACDITYERNNIQNITHHSTLLMVR